MKFKYKVQDRAGGIKEGVIDASDKYTLKNTLQSDGGVVLFVEEDSGRMKFDMESLNRVLARIKTQHLVVFAKNLSAMITAGLSLSRGLDILSRQTDNLKLKDVINELSADIGKGKSLSDGMHGHPKVFSSLFVSMVRVGEESGSLADSLNLIGDQMEKSYLLKRKIKGAMIYPAIVVSAMVIIGVLMFIFVVPTLTATFESIGADLPASTRAIIFISNGLSQHFFLFTSPLVLCIAALLSVRKTSRGKRLINAFILHIPVISKLIKESNAALTTRTLSALLSSGIDMIEAIAITRDVVQNPYYRDVLEIAEKNVQKGIPISSAFSENEKLYPILVGEMAAVGEETGKLSDMLMRTALFYEGEIDAATKNMATIIEPVLMVVIGLAVGFFAVSMISPMYSVMTNI
ncbi:MAG: hypothetical protein COZ49_03615 [Candidatus Yonathbacteria bacterium CG_4_10_14_3_um_filter_47_65]|uniref:Type II secretion system protein GspF domain-containing protein n=2 Tax=Parcubacteria group TaxID=1794811 RepID=A0A2M8D7Y0_9BACT|nr:MAG: hypothetical protein AUJ44_01155 [Candidatus Nomurabacteria bacterium CG1_02_47_685]PIP04238.1 MAG: hypothetical protein COX54_00120 [Candidatus Yonathbacteria bacterium CG23_combo_of_CG06-09_8_20_14_all_46_18]PIQ31939.1 MAG: hypothetical protein COW61_02780 [Candidatus Yonathbacteria bacterium CG17_big_fil_post_rev_8_21_14_2_50_46_19]PIX56146.1 MAG: hypothetical protein COZ49_03615 [Candidatus Yonathbacteria bacterium CG_4_10_14_3_um_filter_47_65]PIY57990.1 MAG: hypothetical protein CO